MLTAIAAILCITIAYLSRGALNPDGVSYLDLATLLQKGDWSHFVQGYWSPLFPFLTGAIGSITGVAGTELVIIAHLINLVTSLAALFILWWWARREAGRQHPWFGRAAIAGFMICSAGLPRIEAVTPDVLLLFVAVWLSYELLPHGGRRWLLTGALLGAAFLAKTSAWPWLIAAVPLRLWAARDVAARRRVWWSTLTAAAVMMLWIVPMSMKAHHLTLGSSGRLNYSWYIEVNSSRLPDTDMGKNLDYTDVPVGDGRALTLATFDDAVHWTYQPWGDPTAWQEKVLTETGVPPIPLDMVTYWLRLTARVFGLWLGPLLLLVLAPVVVLQFRPGMRRELITTEKDAMVVIVLGFIGLLQFAAIHAEPRLIAPSGMMLALGVLSWSASRIPAKTFITSHWQQLLLGWVGVAAALGFAAPKLVEGVSDSNRLKQVEEQLSGVRARLEGAGLPVNQIAIVGPAAPVLSAVYWIGAHITAQIPPASADFLATLPPDVRARILVATFGGRTPVVWQTTAGGAMTMLIVPPQLPAK